MYCNIIVSTFGIDYKINPLTNNIMIHYNQTYFETEGVTILEFGKGTISVCPSSSETDKEVYVLFRTTEAGQIGDYNGILTEGMTASDVKPEVILAFPKAESIDVVIDALIDAKSSLVKIQEKERN